MKKIKSKKRKVKKLTMIGKNLKRDEIGTNQLLNENNINNIVHNIVEKKKDVIIDYAYDRTKYNDFKKNINEQKLNQKYGGNPIINNELKKQSQFLYDKFEESVFKINQPTINYESVFNDIPIYDNIYTGNYRTPIKSNIKYESEFGENIKSQTTENKKRLNNKKFNQLDLFLVDQSEKIIIPSKTLINEWRTKFKSLIDDDIRLNNFDDFVLSYFDPETQNDAQTKLNKVMNKDAQTKLNKVMKEVWTKKDIKYKKEREKEKKINIKNIEREKEKDNDKQIKYMIDQMNQYF